MTMVANANGLHPRDKLLMMAGPKDSEVLYEHMFACFLSGFTRPKTKDL